MLYLPAWPEESPAEASDEDWTRYAAAVHAAAVGRRDRDRAAAPE